MKRTLLLLLVVVCGAWQLSAQAYNGKLGYSISPEGFPYDYSQMGTFLQETADLCGNGVVVANGNWYDDSCSAGVIPALHRTISELQPVPYAYADMLTYAWATYPATHLSICGAPVNSWSNTQMRDAFLQLLISTADSLQPAYLFIGNEVSFYIGIDSLDYLNWISFYHTAYDSVKAHSPSTKVGTIFNYEHLAGTGAALGWTAPHWTALDLLDSAKVDVYGITLYPFFDYTSANAVPVTYLDSLFAHIGSKPLVINETGWPGDSVTSSWNAGAQEQVDFVYKLFSMISGQNVEVVNWLFLNYMMDTTNNPATSLFRSVAMRDSLGNDRPALAVWESMCAANGIAGAQEGAALSVYPNPSRGRITVQLPAGQEQAALELADAQGRCVFRKNGLRQQEEIDTGLAPGLYIYRITVSGNVAAQGKLLVAGD